MLGVSVGVAAGVVFAALAGARRTSSAFDRFTEWSHAADLIVGIESDAEAEKLVGLSGVADVVHLGVLGSPPVFHDSDGRLTAFPTEVTFGVSDGRYLADVERPRFADGRLWEDGAAEAVVNPAFVAYTGLDVGDRLQVIAIPDEVIRRFRSFDELQTAYEADRSIGRTTEVTIVGRAYFVPPMSPVTPPAHRVTSSLTVTQPRPSSARRSRSHLSSRRGVTRSPSCSRRAPTRMP
jgi:hypothetical protein